MAKEPCGKFSTGELLTLIGLFLSIFGGMYLFMRDMRTEIVTTIDRVDVKVEKVSDKIDKHLEYHLDKQICFPNTNNNLIGGLYGKIFKEKIPETQAR